MPDIQYLETISYVNPAVLIHKYLLWNCINGVVLIETRATMHNNYSISPRPIYLDYRLYSCK